MLNPQHPISADNAPAVGIIASPTVEPAVENEGVNSQVQPVPAGLAPGNGLLLADWGNDDRAAALRLWLRQKILTA